MHSISINFGLYAPILKFLAGLEYGMQNCAYTQAQSSNTQNASHSILSKMGHGMQKVIYFFTIKTSRESAHKV